MACAARYFATSTSTMNVHYFGVLLEMKRNLFAMYAQLFSQLLVEFHRFENRDLSEIGQIVLRLNFFCTFFLKSE